MFCVKQKIPKPFKQNEIMLIGYQPKYHATCTICDWHPAFLSTNFVSNISCLSSSIKLGLDAPFVMFINAGMMYLLPNPLDGDAGLYAQRHFPLDKGHPMSKLIFFTRAFQGLQGNNQGALRQLPSLPP